MSNWNQSHDTRTDHQPVTMATTAPHTYTCTLISSWCYLSAEGLTQLHLQLTWRCQVLPAPPGGCWGHYSCSNTKSFERIFQILHQTYQTQLFRLMTDSLKKRITIPATIVSIFTDVPFLCQIPPAYITHNAILCLTVVYAMLVIMWSLSLTSYLQHTDRFVSVANL